MKLDLTVRYAAKTVLDRFQLEAAAERITCILGQSGCGKTTVLNAVAGLVPYEGSIEGAPERISYVFQRDRLLPNLTVRENLRYVLARDRFPDEEERIARALESVELSEAADSYPRALSGGMAQRAALARAFVYPSGLLLLDEPFASLDLTLKHRVMGSFLAVWRTDKRTTLFVTHSIDEALLLADRIVLLDRGAAVLADLALDVPQERRKLSDAASAAARETLFRALGV